MPQAQDARKDFVKIHQNRHQIFAKSFYCKKFIKQSARDVKKIKSKKIDWVLFYSPSAVEAFLRNFSSPREGRQFLQKAKIAVIGETTLQAVRNIQISGVIVPQKPTTEVLFKIIKNYATSIRGIR